MTSHDRSISIAKGIGIILMVVGHSGAPDLLFRFIYMFHMPLFFFVSGYLFNFKYLDNKKQFVWKRIKSLYVPFVKWSIIFLIFHNMLAYLKIYNVYYTWSQIGKKLFDIVTFRGTEQLLGGFWFLNDLFIASIAILLVLFVCKKIFNVIKASERQLSFDELCSGGG